MSTWFRLKDKNLKTELHRDKQNSLIDFTHIEYTDQKKKLFTAKT